MNKIAGTDPSKEQTSQQTYAPLVSVYTARFQGSRPERHNQLEQINQKSNQHTEPTSTLLKKNIIDYRRELM